MVMDASCAKVQVAGAHEEYKEVGGHAANLNHEPPLAIGEVNRCVCGQ